MSDPVVKVIHDDCMAALAALPENSVDAVVTDPPYGLEFMGKEWDRFDSRVGRGTRVASERANEITPEGEGHSTSAGPYLAARVDSVRIAGLPFQQWCQQWAAECLRVLKPGGHLLAFGGTRTYHRLTCAIEDAGLEVRDSLHWVYGSGFPKSHNLKGEREGWGTALKPAHEPIVLARKPLQGTVAANVQEYGTGALNVDGCRVGSAGGTRGAGTGPRGAIYGDGLNGAYGQPVPGLGRWPANLLLTHGEDCEQVGTRRVPSSNGTRGASTRIYGGGTGFTAATGESVGYADADGMETVPDYRCTPDCPVAEMDRQSSGASRFFPVFRYQAKAGKKERPTVDGVMHPTVKPVALMQWLVRLVTPPGGTVLDPFAGSGTTGEAAYREGFSAILIEREDSYLPLIEQRLHAIIETNSAAKQLDLFSEGETE